MFQVKPLQMLNKIKNLADFVVFLGFLGIYFLRPCEKATDQSTILDLGFKYSLLQHAMCPNIFFKNHSTLSDNNCINETDNVCILNSQKQLGSSCVNLGIKNQA